MIRHLGICSGLLLLLIIPPGPETLSRGPGPAPALEELGAPVYPAGDLDYPAFSERQCRRRGEAVPPGRDRGAPPFLRSGSLPNPSPDFKSPRPARILVSREVRDLAQVIKKEAGRHGVDENLVWAVIRQESGFNAQAVSPKGAMGLMQLMPGTAALMGVRDSFNIEQNVTGGVKYLKQCLNDFRHDVNLALAAYNAGPLNVIKYGGCPPFAETKNYVAAVMRDYAKEYRPKTLRRVARGSSAADEAAPSAGSGLQWKVPEPRWKIGKPTPKVPAPRWKEPPPLLTRPPLSLPDKRS